MTTSSMGNSSLKLQIGIDVMKKAMEIEGKEVLSVLQSSALQTPAQQQTAPSQAVADLTGLGQKIDIKA